MKRISARYIGFFAGSLIATFPCMLTCEATPPTVEERFLSPREVVEYMAWVIPSTVESSPVERTSEERRGQIRLRIDHYFDFKEMAKASLGSFWDEATPEEQTEFVWLFSHRLANTYLDRVDTMKPGMVKIENVKFDTGGVKAEVRTTVTIEGTTFPINYQFSKASGKWMVYDVIVENVGLVQNCRNEFASIIPQEKMNGLLQRLRGKNAAQP